MIKRNFLSTAFLASLLISICASSFAQDISPETRAKIIKFRATLIEGTDVSVNRANCGVARGVVTELRKKAKLVRVQLSSSEEWIKTIDIYPYDWMNYVPDCSDRSIAIQ